jgi:hypothetical protein
MHVLLTVLLIAQLLPKFFHTVGGCCNLGVSNVVFCVEQTKLIVSHPLLDVFTVIQYKNWATDTMITPFSKFCHIMHYDEFTSVLWYAGAK